MSKIPGADEGAVRRAAPFVELHTHLEGSLTPGRLISLADRHGRPHLAEECLTDDGSNFRFEGFHGFLDLYRRITSVMRTPADFHAMALDLGEQLQGDGVRYAEITVSFGVLLKRQIDPVAVQKALAEAAAQVSETSGVAMRWIPDAVRQWGTDAAWRAWEAAAHCGKELGVVGFGLGGDETAGPAADFARLFSEVRAEGFGVTIHAGEVPSMGQAARDSIRQAVIACGALAHELQYLRTANGWDHVRLFCLDADLLSVTPEWVKYYQREVKTAVLGDRQAVHRLKFAF